MQQNSGFVDMPLTYFVGCSNQGMIHLLIDFFFISVCFNMSKIMNRETMKSREKATLFIRIYGNYFGIIIQENVN